MKKSTCQLFALGIALGLALSLLGPTSLGQEPPATGAQPWQRACRWIAPGQAGTAAGEVLAQLSGGPDDFGYTWAEGTFDWIDATDGTDAGMSGSWTSTGPIAIGFPFRFYDEVLDQIYIASSGFVSMFPISGSYSDLFPSPEVPNGVIVAYRANLRLADAGPTGRVYYKTGGIAPNRYFVVEWYQVANPCGDLDQVLTFEIVLHENGQIALQYADMQYNGTTCCAEVGIEDPDGLDGLVVTYCAVAIISSNSSLVFSRSAAAARVKVSPSYQGGFARAGQPLAFQFWVRNSGEVGADTYDLSVSSTWRVSLYGGDGSTPLTDSDADGVPDTGSIAETDAVTVTARIDVPASAEIGAHNWATITVRSSLDTGVSGEALLQAAVPAPFAQVYRDDANGAMTIRLVSPGADVTSRVTADGYGGRNPAIVRTPGGFAYFWSRGRYVGDFYVSEVEYVLLNHSAQVVRTISKLVDHSSAAVHTTDSTPSIAVLPDGRLGLLWTRSLRSSEGLTNSNVYFAVLNSAGELLYGPANLTNNTDWVTTVSNGVSVSAPQIAATGDGRLIPAWQREEVRDDGAVSDVYYAVRSGTGSELLAATRLTFDTPGSDEAFRLAGSSLLLGNHALLLIHRSSDLHACYAVLDSSGSAIKDLTALHPMPQWHRGMDAVQLANGNVLIAWWNDSIQYSLLDGYYVSLGDATALTNPAAIMDEGRVSATADSEGHGILTWPDDSLSSGSGRSIFYALVDGDGSLLTPAQVLVGAPCPRIETSRAGYGNTSYVAYSHWVFLPLVLRNH